jgi:hypothetical protein
LCDIYINKYKKKMKNLFLINEDERNRILNLHETATKRQYLSEQSKDENVINSDVSRISSLAQQRTTNGNIITQLSGILKEYTKAEDFTKLIKNYKEITRVDLGHALYSKIYPGYNANTKDRIIPELQRHLRTIGYDMKLVSTGDKTQAWQFTLIPEYQSQLQLTGNQPQSPNFWSMVPRQQNSGSASTDTSQSKQGTSQQTRQPRRATPRPSDSDLDNYLK